MLGRRRPNVATPARSPWPPVVAGPWQPPGGQLDRAVMRDLTGGMLAQGTRVASTSSRHSGTYTGTLPAPQTFLRAPGAPSSAEQLADVGATLNARNALSRNRGRPAGALNPF